MKAWDTQFVEEQLRADNYRKFLRGFFVDTVPRARPRPISYQEFAVRAGFASKSFLNDVIAGKKRLTPSSVGKTAVGLGLNAKWTEYLECLVACEEPAFHSSQHSHEYFLNRLKRKRDRLNRLKNAKTVSGPHSLTVFLDPDFPEVYAALGEVAAGERLEVIAARANITAPRVEKILSKMEKAGFVKRGSEQKYFPIAGALEADNLRSSDVFKNDFFRSLDKARRRFSTQADSNSALFMSQTVSVSQARLPKLRARLAELIVEFADSAEAANGDAVAEICVSLTHNRSGS